jgi:hypothetical protein
VYSRSVTSAGIVSDCTVLSIYRQNLPVLQDHTYD